MRYNQTMRNPLVNTSTVTSPELIGSADKGEWTSIPLGAGQKFGPVYHVDTNHNWKPSSRWEKNEIGRFAGIQKPISKEHANELFRLEHKNMDAPWYLYTFEIFGGQGVTIFQSKVRGGKGIQLNLNHAAADEPNYNILKKELLESASDSGILNP